MISSCPSLIRLPSSFSAPPGQPVTWGAIELAATQRNIKLPTDVEVDAEIDLNLDDGSYFLRARLNVSLPGIDRDIARELLDAAHGICPYSKAVHGNIDVTTNLL